MSMTYTFPVKWYYNGMGTLKSEANQGRLSVSAFVLTLFSLRMKSVNRSQKSVAATQVHVNVISSKFELSEIPGKIKQQMFS